MAELICNVTVKPIGSERVKIEGNFPIYASNIGECMQLAEILNCGEIETLVVNKRIKVSPEVFTSANVRDGTINGKRIRARIYIGISTLRRFIIKHGRFHISLAMHWGDDREIADAEADLSRLMPRPYQSA